VLCYPILYHLLTYPGFSCNGTTEVDRYKPFIWAWNYALQELGRLDDLPLRPPSALQLLFHRNDPMVVMAEHSGHKSHRKPDVVLVPLTAARKALDPDVTGNWADFALNTATSAPQHNFDWNCIYLTAELKRKKDKLTFPPSTFPPALRLIPPQKLHVSLDKVISVPVESMPTSIVPSALESMSTSIIPSASSKLVPGKIYNLKQVWMLDSSFVEPRRSCRLQVKADQNPTPQELSPSDSRKRKMESDTKSAGKRTKTTEPSRIPPMVQSALYATERLSDTFRISHAINLVIVGKSSILRYFLSLNISDR
jgi:hypothetical protein